MAQIDKAAEAKLTAEEIRGLFDYDAETGELRWKVRHANRVRAGQIAGTRTPRGYRIVEINNKPFKAHRIAWLIFYGEWPAGIVDHKNELKDDNRISNLRVANSQESQWNRGGLSRNSFKGIIFRGGNKNKQWRAEIRDGGRSRYLGYYHNEALAHMAYCETARELHGDFFNPGKNSPFHPTNAPTRAPIPPDIITLGTWARF
jgi:hypothetical protein